MKKLENIVNIIKAADCDAILITSGDNRLYASGFISSAGNVLITKDSDAYYLTDSRYVEMASKELPDFYNIENTTGGYTSVINKLIAKHNIKKMLIEDLHLSISEYSDMKENYKTELVFTDRKIDKLRAFLTEEDRDALEFAQSLAEKALAEALQNFKIGMSERDIEAELIYQMYKFGADDLSFKPEIISGANASMPHGNPSDKPIEAGDILLMDFGLVKNGYWSDMTRCFAVDHATDEVSKVYYTVLEAQKRAIDAFSLGMKGKELDAVARNYIMNSGVDGCYQHALGHAIGLLGAAPNLLANTRSEDIILPGSCITFEPGIYQPGKLGCRIEDIVWIGENNEKKNLTHFPKDELIVLK